MKILRNTLLVLTMIGSIQAIAVVLDPGIMWELFGKMFWIQFIVWFGLLITYIVLSLDKNRKE